MRSSKGRFIGFDNQVLRQIIVQNITGVPYSLTDLQKIIMFRTGRMFSESGLSARVRELRQKRYGDYAVKCEMVGTRYLYSIPVERSWEELRFGTAKQA